MPSAARAVQGEIGVGGACRGVVAGLRLISERHLSGCAQGEPIAGLLHVGALERPPGRGFVALPGEDSSDRLRRDGRRLLLAGEAEWGPRVRRLVPYASWLQGLPLLHAAAVERRGGALALIGASGAGKSTLAARLTGPSCRFLTDDLTPCRPRDGGWVVPRSAVATIPLGGLVFLRREPRLRPAAERLNPAAVMRRLVHHGWGDLPARELWRAQFEAFAGLAMACPAVELAIPDDPTRLDESVAVAAALLAGL